MVVQPGVWSRTRSTARPRRARRGWPWARRGRARPHPPPSPSGPGPGPPVASRRRRGRRRRPSPATGWCPIPSASASISWRLPDRSTAVQRRSWSCIRSAPPGPRCREQGARSARSPGRRRTAGPPGSKVQVAHVHAVHGDAAGARLVQAGQQLDQRGLARSVGTHDGQRRAGGDLQVEPVEHGRGGARVGEVTPSKRMARCGMPAAEHDPVGAAWATADDPGLQLGQRRKRPEPRSIWYSSLPVWPRSISSRDACRTTARRPRSMRPSTAAQPVTTKTTACSGATRR